MLVPPANFGIAEEGIYRCSKVETLNLSFLETLDLKTVIFIGGQEPSKFFKEFFNRSSIKWYSIRIADFSNVSAPVNRSGGSPTNDSKNEKPNEVTESDDRNSIYSTTSIISSLNNNDIDEKVTDKVKELNAENNSEGSLDHISKNVNETNQTMLKYTLNDNDELMLIKSYCLKKSLKLLLNRENYNTLLVDKTALIIAILRKIQKWNISSIINEYRLYAGKNRSYFAETFLELIQIRIEQNDIDDISEMKKLELLQLENNRENLESGRKLSSSTIIIVKEEDLCNPPEIPKRLIRIVEKIEEREKRQLNSEEDSDVLLSHDLKRSSSNLGIFGHRYRLAFNKKESGDYDYYKTSKFSEDNKDATRLEIPNELKLPEWFKFQRDLWEQDNAPEVHHFYKEEIFV